MEKNSVLACGIVTYNCNPVRLLEVLAGSVIAFDHIYIYCNRFEDLQIVDQALAKIELDVNVFSLVGRGENVGLAQAQNKIAGQASNDGYDWLTFLDQDSVVHDEDRILRDTVCANHIKNNAFVIEYNKNSLSFFGGPRYYNASSLTVRISDFIAMGGFLSALSIDWVDFEFCDRIYRSGGNIIPVNGIAFDHQLGDDFEIILGRKIHLRNDTRYYYVIRNAVYLLRQRHITINFRSLLFARLLFYCLLYTVKSDKKRTVFLGLYDGLRGEMGTKVIGGSS